MENLSGSVAALHRVHPLIRDIIFPFYEIRQFITLAGLTSCVFLIAFRFSDDPWGYSVVAWISGQAVLATVSPAIMTVDARRRREIQRSLALMRFKPVGPPERWTYDRPNWTKWGNSDVYVAELEEKLILRGPLSTLTLLRRKLSR